MSRPELAWLTVLALRKLGGSGRVSEIDEKAIRIGRFTDRQQSEMMPNGKQPKLAYELGWGRTFLKRADLAENSARAVWSLTKRGRNVDRAECLELVRQAPKRPRQGPGQPGEREVPEKRDSDENGKSDDWRTEAKDCLKRMSPDAFERLAGQLLREAGFRNIEVLGKSGDGGIDGVGVYRLSLVSFPVYFQCKRYSRSVSAGAVRDFRGAMAGRGEKGLLITSGWFTASAQKEATRDGAAPVELVDGDALCDLLKQYGLGISVTQRIVEDIHVDPTYFSKFEK